MDVRVAITGGIAEGKSTVLGYLRELGYRVASADEIARDVFLDPAVNPKLALLAGTGSNVTRDQLREAISREPSLRRQVNALMHPTILRAMTASDAQFVEVPLLIEACLQGGFPGTWVVTCGREEQMRRLIERYGDRGQAEALMSSQLSTRVKIAFADAALRTNDDPDHVRRLVSEEANSLFGGPA